MRKILLILLLPSLGFATTTAKIVSSTAQQAILRTNTSYSGNCSLVVSTSATYAPTIYDLDSVKFSGANLDSNSSIIWNGNNRDWTIGKRGTGLNTSDMRKYSRSLFAETPYYWQETCGSDVVSGTFTTTTIKFGTTYADPRYDKTRPGESQFPTMFYTTNTIQYADPYTGARLIRGSMPQDVGDFVTTETFKVFKSTLNGVGWTVSGTSATYNGTSQNAIFLAAGPTSVLNGIDNRDIASLRLQATIKGTAANVNVCITANGESCISGTITQAITSSFVAYTIGTSTPMLESWRNGPTGFLRYSDISVQSGNATVAADGKNVALNNNTYPPYFNINASSGSLITIGSNVLAISSVTSQIALTLSSSTATGSQTFSMQNFGFLVWDASNSNDTITISTATYLLEAVGSAQGVASGSWQICDPLMTTGPTGPGTLCYLSGRDAGYIDNIFIWIGTDGTITSLGQCSANIAGTGLSNGTCYGQVGWDVSVPGKYYIVAGGPNSTQVVAAVTYTGNYTSSPAYYGAPAFSSTATIISADINTMVHSFDATFSTTNFIDTDWQAQDSVPYGTKGAMILINDNQSQNSPAWVAMFDLNTNAIIAAVSTFGGAQAKPNRWFGLHGVAKSYGGNWVHISGQDGLQYYVGLTSNTFNANYVNCPANSIDPTVVGQPLCTSTVILSTNIPNNSGANLYGIKLSTGDNYFLRDNGSGVEKVRIMTLNGLNAVFERCLQSYYYGSCGDHTNADTWDLQVSGAINTGDINWDFVNDPHGQGIAESYGNSLAFDPNAQDCHEIWGDTFINAACTYPPNYAYPIFNSYPYRPGPLPNFSTPLQYTLLNGGFAGDNQSVGNNIIGSHPSIQGTKSNQMLDTHPVMGLTVMTNGTPVGLVSGTKNIWRIQQTNTYFNYRLRPFVFFSGEKQMADVSPNIITDTPADYYKFCVTITAGDCYAGSSVGDVYADLPFVAYPYGNNSFLPPDPYMRDLSIGAMEGVMDYSTQMIMNGSDFEGANVRLLTTDMRIPRVGVNYDNGRETMDNKWHFQNTWHNGLFKNDFFIAQIPSIQQDTKARWTYMPKSISVGGRSGDSIRIRFGYQEYGTISQFYCSPRQMQCSTDATATQPYLWSDETQQWKSCSSGCTLNIPVLPGHYAYYVIDRKNGNNITTSPIQWTTGE